MATNFKTMSKAEILKLTQEVSASLKTIGTAELNQLVKSEGSSSEASLGKGSIPAEGSEGSSGSPEGSEGSASASEGAPPAGPDASAAPSPAPGPDAGGAPPAPEGSAPPAGPPGAPADAGASAAPAGPSFEELVSLYVALATSSPQDFEAHAAAMQQAMSQVQGASPAGAPPGAPPGAPSAPGASPSAPPAGASPSPAPFGKQEVATATKTGPTIGLEAGSGKPGHVETHNPNIGKSEEDALTRLAKAESDLAAIGKVVETILTVPQRKAVTGLTVIPMRKSEPDIKPLKKSFGELTRAELHVALTRVSGTPKLNKAERELVDAYYLSPGSVNIAELEPIYNKA